MKQKILIVVFIGALTAIAGFLIFNKSKPNDLPPELEHIMTEEEQRQKDLDVLQSGTGRPHEIYGAMIRLAQKQEEIARKEALKRASDESQFLRGGAAQALGYFSDSEAQAALKKLLSDPDKSVRHFAIQGLGTRTDSLGESDLLKLLEGSNQDDETKVVIYSSLLKAASTQQRKDAAVSNLLKIAYSGEGEAATAAAQKLVSQVPENPQVVDLIRKKISESKNEKVMASGIRYLSSKNDPWIRDALNRLVGHPSPMVRSAVIQSLHRVCPPDRWKMLDQFLQNEKEEPVLKLVLEEPMFLLGEPAVEFLKKALASPKLTEGLKKTAQDSLAKVQSSPGAELCQTKAVN